MNIYKNYLAFIITSSFFMMHTALYAQAPNWLWAKSIGGSAGNDIGRSVEIDPAGAVYITGNFSGTVDFDPGPGIYNLTAIGFQDIYISKLDSAGNFKWAKAFGGPLVGGYETGRSITIDHSGSGDIFVAGEFCGTADFDPGLGVFNLTSVGNEDIFISRFDSSGNFIWAKSIEGSGGGDFIGSIASGFTGNGEIYCTGQFHAIADFDPGIGVFNLTAGGDRDIFISKLDGSGNFAWAVKIGETSLLTTYESGNSIAVDSAGGGVYATGCFWGTTDFDPGPGVFNLVSSGTTTDIFITKFDSSGNFIWAKALGGLYTDCGSAIAVDWSGNGDLYITGYFAGTADFDPGPGVFNLVSPGTTIDIFITKFDSSGNFMWAKSMGGSANDGGLSLAVDPAGNGDVYATGIFRDTADFDPGPGIFPLFSAGGQDIFISRLDSSGNFIWAKSVLGADDDASYSIALDAAKHTYITGHFRSPTISFGSDTLIDAGWSDLFIAKLEPVISTGNSEIKNFGNGVLLFPNPAANHLNFTFENYQNKVDVIITDVTGNIIYSTTSRETQKIEVNTRDFAQGIYVVRIRTADFIETKKLIVAK